MSEDDIAAETARRWREHHDWMGPEGAACLAAVPQLLDRGLIKRGDNVVVVNTASLEKYLPALQDLL